jgi:hypothetical protein
MAVGPLVSAGGVMYLLVMIDESPGFLADADERNAGIASRVNNAVARVAGLLATAAVGTIAGGTLDLGGLRMALAGAAGLLALGGITGLCAIRNPRRLPVVAHAQAPAG